jgi:putative transposase
VVGPKGRHDAERTAKRHGHTGGEVTLGGRRVPVSRPRVRSVDDGVEVDLESYAQFSTRDVLERVMLERMLAGVSTRRAQRVAEPVGSALAATGRSTSKSAVSRAFVRGTRAALDELLARRLDDLELAVVMVVAAKGSRASSRCAKRFRWGDSPRAAWP